MGRSRVSVTSSAVVSSKVPSSPDRKSSSCPPTLPPTLVPERCSPSKCTTRTCLKPFLGTTCPRRVTSWSSRTTRPSFPPSASTPWSKPCYIRTAHSAMRIAEILKVRSKETGNQWSTEVKQLTSNCAAEVVLVPQQPISCDTFDNCPNLARIAVLEGFNCCAIGKITKIE